MRNKPKAPKGLYRNLTAMALLVACMVVWYTLDPWQATLGTVIGRAIFTVAAIAGVLWLWVDKVE